MLRFVSAVLMLLAFSSFAQNTTLDPATGNLVYTTVNPAPQGADPHSWSGFGTTTINGGGLSGGHVPAYNTTTGTFMFGYNQGTVAYTTAVNQALAIAGTGIQVRGLRYSWEYFNQDMSRGTLTGNISLTSNTGQTLQNYTYNMPQTTTGWTRMSGTENFSTMYAPSSLGNLNVSFTGKDDRWWAGYYGPQIRDIGVNLLFSVATPPPIPTDFLRWVRLVDENGEFTLTRPGVVRYGAQDSYIYRSFEPGTYSCSNSAWGNDPIGGVGKSCSLGSNTTTTTPTVPTTTTPTTTQAAIESATTLLEPVTTTTTTTTTSNPAATVTDPVTATITSPTTVSTSPSQPGTVASVVSAPAPTTSSTSTASSSSSSSASTTSTTQSARESNQSGSNNVGLALSVISRNQERDAAGSAVAQSAVAQAQQAANQAQQEATSVAANAVANSTTMNAATTSNQQSNTSGGSRTNNNNSSNFTLQSGLTSSASLSGPQSSSNMFVQQQSNNTSVNVINNQLVAVVNVGSQQASNNTVTTFAIPLLQPQQQINLQAATTTTQTEAPIQAQTTLQSNKITQTVETYSIVPPNFLTDKSNPLTEIIENKQNIPQNSTIATTGPSVNKNASDSEVAGGVDINRMALAPVGYNGYLNFTLRDAMFYAPKEVYANQRNVDNARALRLLTNDSKHKEMVEMQYAR